MTRWRWTMLIVAVVLAGLFATFSWMGWRRVYRTVQSSEQQLRVAGVHPGIPADRLLAVLDSLDAEHSTAGKDGVIEARIGRSFDDWMIDGAIFASFRVDSANRLESQFVHEILTGP